MTLTITRYQKESSKEWDLFIRSSKNGTFILERDFMDYHADRFVDHSLLFYEKNKLLAVMPANQDGDTLYSHQGLTYGGIVSHFDMTTERMLQLFSSLIDYCKSQSLKSIYYKTIPYIYHRVPAEEDRLALFHNGAELCERLLLSVCLPRSRPVFQERRMRGVKRGAAEGIAVRESKDWSYYWAILAGNLDERYGSKPVHSFEEITLLRSSFPDGIRLFVAEQKSDLLAGVVIFENDQVAHVQYIASTEAGRDIGAVDTLFYELIYSVYSEKMYFDFGSSNVPGKMEINPGLVSQKEGFDARAVVQDHYKLNLK